MVPDSLTENTSYNQRCSEATKGASGTFCNLSAAFRAASTPGLASTCSNCSVSSRPPDSDWASAASGAPPCSRSQLSASFKPCPLSQASACSWLGIGKANLRQRDKIVGSKRSRLFDASRNKVPGGGSSSVFSSALEAGKLSASAGYSTTTRKPW